MIELWAAFITISCSEPRLPFRDFYEQIYHVKYPAQRGEDMGAVNSRALEGFAEYVSYTLKYSETCRSQTPISMCSAGGKSWPARTSPTGGSVCWTADAPK